MLNPFGILVLAIFFALFLYANIMEKRSLRANRLEKLIWLSKAKKVFENKNEKFLNKYIASLREQNLRPYKLDRHLIRFKTQEETLSNMQVFSWCGAKKQDRVLIYLHGGAFISPPLSPHFLFANRLSKSANARIYLPIYKKIPDFNYKICLDELLSLYKEILRRHQDKEVSLVGDSAGASLCLSLLQRIKDADIKKPKCCFCLSPWLDLSMENKEIPSLEKIDPSLSSWGLRKLGEIWSKGDLKNPLASPLFGDYVGCSNIHIFVGTREIFLPDCLEFDKLLGEQGVYHSLSIAKNMYHVYPLFPVPEAKKVIKFISKAMLSKL